MARDIQAFKLRTEVVVDNAKASTQLRATERDVDKLGQRFTRLGPEIDKALKGKELGAKFGKSFGASATALITGSFDSLGQTLGSLIGTAILPGVGTAIGSTVGSGVDAALNKISGPMQATIAQGIELNKVLESTRVEFTAFSGSAEEADQYLNRLLDTSKRTGILPTTLIEASESVQDLTQNLKLTSTILSASIEQAADIGGGPGKLRETADALGLIAEKGDLSATSLRTLYKLKIDAPARLAEGFGLSVKEVEKLIAEGRIRGDIAAQVIAESILREKAGFAEKLAASTVQGGEDLFKARSLILAARGTQTATRKWGDFAQRAAGVLQGPGADQFAAAIDDNAASFFGLVQRGIPAGFDFVQKGVPAGVNLVQGIGEGLTSASALSFLYSSLGKLKSAVGEGLETTLEIKSPSKFSARVAGEPLGEGIAIGIETGFCRVFQTRTLPAIGYKFEEFIRKYSKEFNVPAELIYAVMMQESSGNPRALSRKGAAGLMQLMPGTAKRFGVTDRFDPEQSIRGGTHYLRFLMNLFGGDVDLVLAGYNAGEGAVKKFGNRIPPYAETQDYVRRIKARLGAVNLGPVAANAPAVVPLGPGGDAVTGALMRFGQGAAVLAQDPQQAFNDILNSTDRAVLNRLSGISKETMDRLAQVEQGIRVAEAELAKTRPAATGSAYSMNAEYAAAFRLDRLKEESERLNKTLAEVNHQWQGILTTTFTLRLGEKTGVFSLPQKAPSVPIPGDFDDALDKLAESTLPKVSFAANETGRELDFTKAAFGDFGLGLPPLMQGMQGVSSETQTLTKLNADYQESLRRVGITGSSMLSQLAGALGQVAGFMPQQEVGKKRGFFSKLLGVAAPFLSLIPGVGPLLSTVAGIASAGLGGNWSGVVTGIAGGLQPGGVFRSSNRTGSTGQAAAHEVGLSGTRARGGPGTRSRVYWTGEEGPEPFLAPANGRFLSHPDAMRALAGSVGGNNDHGALISVLRELRAVQQELRGEISRLRSMPPGDVVTAGAHGLVSAMDADAGLIRLISQRQRLR